MVMQLFYDHFNRGFMTLILTYPEVWKKLNVCMLQLHSLDCRQDLSPLNIVPCYFTQSKLY